MIFEIWTHISREIVFPQRLQRRQRLRFVEYPSQTHLVRPTLSVHLVDMTGVVGADHGSSLLGIGAVNEILADPKSKARFTDLGASLLPGSPADFGKLLADETEKWGKVVKFSGAKPD